MDNQELNREFVVMCKKHNLNSSLAREILILKSQGYNTQEVAEQLGITRNTVYSYTKTMQGMEKSEFLRFLILAAAVIGGITIIKKILEKK